ncbi:hypothetical protein M409DRAFT_28327 [Zasmidium cellare ATCC 36951]|uniref:Aminoglycoside phosphotransferase domain-containing protein n=1 Tax=Zasmidium cellare ATCC 36951 TaxID=1080233 RepID=A0A6A6C6B0_ZASCE|nr:uncharacterized protein M409DRAFT_28327 [Zasmidium cellare ATCC 36951]KAF2161289.1 hypothetical protein M409DRAFT_28327 [Zasmidium cellare ATCC 36951]
MEQLTFDASLRTELAPCAVDFPKTSFFRFQGRSPNKPALPTTAEVRARAGCDDGGYVAFPDLKLFVKFGRSHNVSLEEAQMLQAVRRAFPNNQIPVPELVAWRAEDEINYIYMSLIPGTTLESCWPELTLEEKTRISDQLGRMVSSLRSIHKAPGTEYVGIWPISLAQALHQLIDRRLPRSRTRESNVFPRPNDRPSSKFCNISRRSSILGFALETHGGKAARPISTPSSGIYFSHGDLHLHNIMVAGTPGSRRVSGLVDWGFAGWFPEYWEYYNMVFGTHDHEWYTQGWINRVLTSYDGECEALDNYWSWRGPA